MDKPSAAQQETPAGERLDSWKEIASYLRRSVRSVQRWEAEEGMPVRRHLHEKRGTVYAFQSELDAWWKERGSILVDESGAEETAPPLVEPPPLEQRPRRVAWVAIGFAVAVLVVGIVAWLSRGGSGSPAGSLRPLPFKARDWVLVADFENRTGEKLFDGTLEYALGRELSNSRYVNVVPRERINDSLELMRKPSDARVDAAVGREICVRDGEIRALLTGRIEKLGSKYLFSVEIVEPKQGTTLAGFSDEATGEDGSLAAARRISDRVRAALGEASPPEASERARLVKVTTPNLRALQLYSQADLLISRDKPAAAEELLRQAVAEDPNFASAYIHLAYAIHNQNRPLEEYRPHLDTAFRLAETTTERERHFIRASYYHLLHQREKAIAAYEALLSLCPDHVWALGNLASLYGIRDIKRTIQLERRLADARPKEFIINEEAAYDSVRWSKDPASAQPSFDRARELVMTPEALEQWPWEASWIELWPATEHWLKGDLEATTRELDRVATKVDVLSANARDFFAARAALGYLALGKIEEAERISRKSVEPAIRSAMLVQVAFLKEDAVGLRRHLLHDPGDSPLRDGNVEEDANSWRSATMPFLQARAGLLPQALRSLKEMEKRGAGRGSLETLRGEIALAQGDLDSAIRELEEGTKLAQDLGSRPQFHLGSESLAIALRKKGDVRRAVEILEQATLKKFPAAVSRYEAVPYWMRNRLDLAKLYRGVGRVEEARAIEADLTKLLALADADHPILVELRRLQRS